MFLKEILRRASLIVVVVYTGYSISSMMQNGASISEFRKYFNNSGRQKLNSNLKRPTALRMLPDTYYDVTKIQEERHKQVQFVCQQYKNKVYTEYIDFYFLIYDKNHDVLYGIVPKVASTTWIQLLVYYSGRFSGDVPFSNIDIFDTEKYGVRRLSQVFSLRERAERIKKSFSFIFGRNPFERLISAYHSRINPGIPIYHRRVGKGIISKYRSNASQESLQGGHDVTFSEFIHYIVDSKEKYDEHWRPQYLLSHPCLVNYTYIGKFETLHQDMGYLLHKVFEIKNINSLEVMHQTKMTNNSEISKYYKNIPQSHIDKLRTIYKYDFLFFNYSTAIPGDT